MSKAPKLALFAKGFCMGIADVIPGVSGGTVALILGIYARFIEAVRSVNPKPVFAGVRWAMSGFKADGKAAFMEALGTVHLGFLIPLACGIGLALGVGSVTIPTLMEQFPEIMRGLFFGLIVASVFIPLRMIPRDDKAMVALAVVMSVIGAGAGYLLTDPNRIMDTTSEWVVVEVAADAEAASLKDTIRRGPSAQTAEQVYWSERNTALRAAVAKADPKQAAELDTLKREGGRAVATDKRALKARAAPYNDVMVPPGTAVHVPRPSMVFIFFAGAIAICAMVLPGISGSFLLLVMGCYYFVLNAVKGALKQLASGELPIQSVLYIGLFVSGIAVGLLTFARIMSYLLRKHPAPTMGALSGLMIGCLRGIWPYQSTVNGKLANVVPATWGSIELAAIGAAVVGVALVGVLTVVGDRLEPDAEA